jgi:hypothetical protein
MTMQQYDDSSIYAQLSRCTCATSRVKSCQVLIKLSFALVSGMTWLGGENRDSRWSSSACEVVIMGYRASDVGSETELGSLHEMLSQSVDGSRDSFANGRTAATRTFPRLAHSSGRKGF